MAVKYSNLTGSIKRVILGGVNIGLTPFEILIANANGGTSQIPSVGTSGQVLTSAGPGANPNWANLPASGPADKDVWLTGLEFPTGLGYTGQAETFPRIMCNATNSLTSGTPRWTGIPMPAGITLNKMTMVTTTTVEAGGTHGWYALTDNTGKVVAVTADQTGATVWSPSGSPITLPFTAPYTTTYRGLYFIWVCVTASTSPTLQGLSVLGQAASLAPALGGNGAISQFTPPALGATLAFTTPTGTIFYAIVG